MGKLKNLIIFLMILLQMQFLTALAENNVARKYILGPNDIISIFVYDSPELNQEKIRLQPDGKIVIEPLGSIQVAGLTIDELHDLLAKKYKHYLNDPKISIKLEQTKSFIVYITGAVSNPGSYEINTDIENNNNGSSSEINVQRKSPLLSNILVVAGGVCHDADLEHIKIFNSYDNKQLEVNLLDLLDTGNSNQDVYLITGDTVYIPRLPTPLAVNAEKYKKYASASFSPKEVPVRVFGYVNNPGLIRLNSSESLSINSAITSVGGYVSNAAYPSKKVYLSRVDNNGKFVTTVINPMSNDAILMPNDIVYVPEKPREVVGKVFDYISRIITPASNAANSYNNWSLMFNPTRFSK